MSKFKKGDWVRLKQQGQYLSGGNNYPVHAQRVGHNRGEVINVYDHSLLVVWENVRPQPREGDEWSIDMVSVVPDDPAPTKKEIEEAIKSIRRAT